MGTWKWIEAAVFTALVHQAMRVITNTFVLVPEYLSRAQLWRFPQDRVLLWMPLVFFFLGFSVAYVYWRARPALPGRGWRRGLAFGFWVWMIGAVPCRGARFVLMPIPVTMSVVNVLADLAAFLITGLILYRVLEHPGRVPQKRL